MRGPTVRLPTSLKPAIVCLILVAVVLTGLGIAEVARRQRVIELGYQLTDAVTEQHRLEEENRRLRLEKSVLTSPERIERLARAVGMSQPSAGQVIVVHPEAATVASAPQSPEERPE